MDRKPVAAEDKRRMQKGWKLIDEKWYWFGSNGAMVTGWLTLKGKTYYLNEDGTAQFGWMSLEDNWYRFGSNGAMIKGWTKHKGKWYYLDEAGAMVKSCKLVIDGKEYTFNKNGVCLNP